MKNRHSTLEIQGDFSLFLTVFFAFDSAFDVGRSVFDVRHFWEALHLGIFHQPLRDLAEDIQRQSSLALCPLYP